MLLVAPVLALSQAGQESRTLIVNGQPGQVAVVQMNGHSYVDLEALAERWALYFPVSLLL